MRALLLLLMTATVVAGCADDGGDAAPDTEVRGDTADSGLTDATVADVDLDPAVELADEADGSSSDVDADGSAPSDASPADVAADAGPVDATVDADSTDVLVDDGCEPVGGEPTWDTYGGDVRLTLEATGFFRAEKVCGRWWLVTPDGHPFWSAGVNSISPTGPTGQVSGVAPYGQAVAARYDTTDAWADATVGRLRSWGFNTAGAWSSTAHFAPRMPTTPILYLSQADWLAGTVPDYYSEAWAAEVQSRAATVAQWSENPNIVGYFLDNEMHWGPDWRDARTLLAGYLELDADAPGKAVAVDALLSAHGGLDGLNAALGRSYASRDDVLADTTGWSGIVHGASEAVDAAISAFLTSAAGRYYSVASTAVRAHDPNHLILGNREVSVMVRLEVYEAAAPWVDVISINSYQYVPGLDTFALNLSDAPSRADGFAAVHAAVDLPIMVTEFGFRAQDAGLPNSWPPVYPKFRDQLARTDAFDAYVAELQGYPWLVGAHWFEWVDQPAEGRFDGEDNNWGLVTSGDDAYEVLTMRAAETLPRVYQGLRRPR
jgi:agarase